MNCLTCVYLTNLLAKVTSAFHKHTRLQNEAMKCNDVELAKYHEKEIEKIGGRQAYQAASVLSVKHFSTSKWVLSSLRKLGFLKMGRQDNNKSLSLLEIGAINNELIEAGIRSKIDSNKTRINVRAIDVQSQHPGIEEMDFFNLPDPHHEKKSDNVVFDVIVCSMVINCVPTPEQRGQMLLKIRRHMNSEALLFLTLPLTCLVHSKYIDRDSFRKLLNALGYQLIEEKESPKVAFYILKLAQNSSPSLEKHSLGEKHVCQKLSVIKRGKKYRVDFGIVISSNSSH